MSHVDVWLRESTATSLLQALSTLRRLITFHKEFVEDCLDDLVQLMQRLLSHEAPPVRAAAALGVGDLCVAFGDSMLSHMQHGDNLDASLLLAMIQLACTSTPVAAAAAKASLGIYATRLRQASVMRQLEHYLQYPVAPIRTKASLLLMTATYRLS
ncbi:hypothetical protein H632_c2889p0 [Helicosporidium sp. ATCC 50920]|nr:hypothetical protein H632_c2889p0 [Helicosporidium sp. ATCC 50920]|eukprot:KDD72795.1 hypothetical protein H632_c2889p0 [Helicosporidium sp. ATCC 50920]